MGFTLFPLASPFGFRSRILDFAFENLPTLLLGSCNFQTLIQDSLLRCLVSISLFTFHFSCPCHWFQVSCFIVAAVTRSCLVSKLRFFLNSCDFKFPLYHSHVHADHFNYFIPRSLGSQSFCYPPSASLVSLSRFIATSFGSLRTFTYGGGYACVVSVSRFALLRAFG